MEKINMLLKRHKILIFAVVIIIFIAVFGGYQYKVYADNRNFDNNITQAESYYKSDQFIKAKGYYQAALKYKDSNDIKKKIKLCDDMKSSYDNFNNGVSLFNKKDYLNAYNSFKEVISEDKKRYDKAKTKADESATLYINDQIVKAKDSANKAEYQDAINCMAQVMEINSDNKKVNELESQAKQLKSQYESQLQQKDKQDAINNARSIIHVTSIYTSEPNTASGVDLHIVWTNTSNKVVKYAKFEVVPYNAVGDPQECTIRHEPSFKGQATGPINPGQTWGYEKLWENAWYNSTIVKAQINQIDITYMDGTTATLDKDQVQYVLN
ncbi:Tetratricopeptide repeat protein [Clostridium ljungdahlii DSM 13528]|uniref:Tetratricopeptide repeat protein n=1 Tax=Clostridium ljungdahlii (strain ATCC 55383 / DSM 13528 / PETC) TaxID=748727 RepID=D8GU80_CLOLD|nr:hypothetical protein [Clostridium ljungdahlii]ADK14743.1 conserved hypothetical protein [Clostridium ljungdahlii DSM 13528]OAA84100.1 Tetratricopeptide repeat protein [Clostridium ljungdahlii DSM 13528]